MRPFFAGRCTKLPPSSFLFLFPLSIYGHSAGVRVGADLAKSECERERESVREIGLLSLI